MQSDEPGDELAQLTVLASNNEGYQNLTPLDFPRLSCGYGAAGLTIDRDWLIEHREGLILLPARVRATSASSCCAVTRRRWINAWTSTNSISRTVTTWN